MIIELYQMLDKLLLEISNRKNGNINHIAFNVNDIDTNFQILKENGLHILEEKPVFLNFWSIKM